MSTGWTIAFRVRCGAGTHYQMAKDAKGAIQALVLAAALPMPAFSTDSNACAVFASWGFSNANPDMCAEIRGMLGELSAGTGIEDWYGPPIEMAQAPLHDVYEFFKKLDRALDAKRDEDSRYEPFHEALAQLSLGLITVAEAAQQAGATPDQLEHALRHRPTARAVDELVLHMNRSGDASLLRAMNKLEAVVADPAASVTDISTAANALIRLRTHAISRPRTTPRGLMRSNATPRRALTQRPTLTYQFDTALLSTNEEDKK